MTTEANKIAALSAEPAQEMTDERICDLMGWNVEAMQQNEPEDLPTRVRALVRVAEAEAVAADRASRLPEMASIPSGWKITQDDKRPFKCIEISAPDGSVARVMSHERNPSNVLYMLAEAMLRGEKT